ncbi:glycosyltransferase family 4 protein [Candidatus Nitrosocosmicus franklandus]|nr:glycosyltransferase family 4 protein [Candidatus Nitrosocosmicus franklandus]
MNILFMLYMPNPYSGAAWNRIGFLANFFKNKGNNVTISGTFNPFSGEKLGRYKFNGIQILNLTPLILKLNIFSSIFNVLSLIFTGWLPFIITKPDIVLISVPPGEPVIISYTFARLFRPKKIIFDYRDQWEDYAINQSRSSIYKLLYGMLKSLITKYYKKSDYVVTVTEALSDDLLSRGIKKVKIIPNGADVNIFKPQQDTKLKCQTRKKFGIDDNDFVLVYSGMIGLYYKLDVVIKALKSLLNDMTNIKLIVIGDGSNLEQYLDLVRDLGLNENVLYLGKKDRKDEIVEILNSADIGIIPYDSNPLWNNAIPSKSLEYLACGLPVVATIDSNSILGKLLEKNEVGISCEPENIDQLAIIIKQIYDEKSFRERAREKAVALIQKNFDRNKLAEEYYRLIK